MKASYSSPTLDQEFRIAPTLCDLSIVCRPQSSLPTHFHSRSFLTVINLFWALILVSYSHGLLAIELILSFRVSPLVTSLCLFHLSYT